jgi:hypothetical protein
MPTIKQEDGLERKKHLLLWLLVASGAYCRMWPTYSLYAKGSSIRSLIFIRIAGWQIRNLSSAATAYVLCWGPKTPLTLLICAAPMATQQGSISY